MVIFSFLVSKWSTYTGLEFLSPPFYFPLLLPAVHSSHSALSPDPRYRTCGLRRKLQTPSVRNRSASPFLQSYRLTIHPLDYSEIILITAFTLHCSPALDSIPFDVICVWSVDALSSLGISRASWCTRSVFFQNFLNTLSYTLRQGYKNILHHAHKHIFKIQKGILSLSWFLVLCAAPQWRQAVLHHMVSVLVFPQSSW